MPIIIDTENPLKDIERINKEIKATDHSPKFFSTKLTGEGKSRGLIQADSVELNDQLQKHGTDLMDDSYITPRVLDDMIKQTMYIGSYENTLSTSGEPRAAYMSREDHTKQFNQASNLFDIDDTVPLETINPLLINNFSFNMDMPLDTVLWDLDNVDSWAVIDETNEKVLRGKVLFSHLTLLHKEETKQNGTKTHKYPFILTPFLLLSVSNKNNQQTHLTINNAHHVDPLAHRVRIVPIRIGETAHVPSQLQYMFGYPNHAHLDNEALATIADFTTNQTIFGTTHANIDALKVDGIMKFIHETNIYDTLCEQAKRYKEDSMNQFVRIIKELKDMYDNDPNQAPHNAREDLIASMYSLINQLESIEEQGGKIGTDDLNEVYQTIMDMNLLSANDKDNIVRQSLRLLLAHRLNTLNTAKQNGELYDFDPQDTSVTDNVKGSSLYSQQQKDIILTQEPLAIGQAGAGSGKSHTVTGRIHYLQAQKEDLDRILVLSFTNVAAQNITSRFPGIKSKTLADMFHSIYKESFPEQHLSTPGTLVNSLSLINPHSAYFTQVCGHDGDEVEQTRNRLRGVLKGFIMKFGKNNDVQNTMRILMNLVDEKREIVMDLLTATEQTTLELEPIIIHNFLNNDPNGLTIPIDFQNLRMIITDESQDISTFEYIMLIDMALHYGCQLLIVGDGSQTLYEFRNSDPRYLNALEASGVFETYKLETNYRSNAEVLSFANQFLQVIEANDVAKIQLRANSFKTPTVKSFKEKVTVYAALPSDPQRKTRTHILEDHLVLNQAFLDWFYERVDKGEQIAFLAHTRRDVAAAENAINQLLKDHGVTEEVTNIVSKRTYEKKYISDVLIAIREDFVRLNPASSSFLNDAFDLIDETDSRVRGCFGKGIPAKILTYNVQDIRDTFKKVVNQPMVQVMRKECVQNKRNGVEIMNFILQAMLREETRQNNMQHVLEPKKELDLSSVHFIVSTIHAAKGLEFDHTIVVHHQTNSASRVDKDKMQEELRMLFVACSRAKDSQWIINTQLTPPVSVSSHQSSMYDTPMATAYLRVVDELHEAETAAAQTLP